MRKYAVADDSPLLSDETTRVPLIFSVGGFQEWTLAAHGEVARVAGVKAYTPYLTGDGTRIVWTRMVIDESKETWALTVLDLDGQVETDLALSPTTPDRNVTLTADICHTTAVIAEQSRFRTTDFVVPPGWLFQECSLRLGAQDLGGAALWEHELKFHETVRMEDSSPVQISPDGTKVAVSVFVTDPTDLDWHYSTRIYDMTTGDLLTSLRDVALHGTCSWSSDGRRLLLSRVARPVVHDLSTGTTTPLGEPFGELYVSPRKNFHRPLGWAGSEHIVTAFQRGKTLTINLVHAEDGEVSPLFRLGNGDDMYAAIAALEPDEWRALGER